MAGVSHEHTAILRLVFPDAAKAQVACQTLAVDDELQPEKIQKDLSTEGNTLVVRYAATEHRLLRVAMSSVFDGLGVTAKAIREFG